MDGIIKPAEACRLAASASIEHRSAVSLRLSVRRPGEFERGGMVVVGCRARLKDGLGKDYEETDRGMAALESVGAEMV
jgi:hypothetical protein